MVVVHGEKLFVGNNVSINNSTSMESLIGSIFSATTTTGSTQNDEILTPLQSTQLPMTSSRCPSHGTIGILSPRCSHLWILRQYRLDSSNLPHFGRCHLCTRKRGSETLVPSQQWISIQPSLGIMDGQRLQGRIIGNARDERG